LVGCDVLVDEDNGSKEGFLVGKGVDVSVGGINVGMSVFSTCLYVVVDKISSRFCFEAQADRSINPTNSSIGRYLIRFGLHFI
jgi:hypothetical protein